MTFLTGRTMSRISVLRQHLEGGLRRDRRAVMLGGISGRSSMVERQLPKLHTGVRFPSPAPDFLKNSGYLGIGGALSVS